MTVALFIGAFLLGSIPFGVYVARRHGVDIRAVGSGNPGATNVYRSVSKSAGLLVYVFDCLKGVIPTSLAWVFVKEPMGSLDRQTVVCLVGVAAILGHCFSPFLGFRGGKGVATLSGVAIVTAPLVALPGVVIFAILLVATRYMSLSSMLAAWITLPLCLVVPGQSPQILVVFACVAVFITVMHRKNIGRLIRGEEPKFEFRSRK